jgi:hypothetical protein
MSVDYGLAERSHSVLVTQCRELGEGMSDSELSVMEK